MDMDHRAGAGQTLALRGFHQGYDPIGGGGPAGMTDPLSSRRDLVEQLDPEPLYDYLVQNGVLEASSVAELRAEVSPAKTNLGLLRAVEDHGKAAQGLLLIGLRQTGQHHLANLLDDSARIKALSGSGYLSKSRHKGQLNLRLQVKAVKLAPESFRASTGEILSSREWVSLSDVLHNGHSAPADPPTADPQPPPEVNGSSAVASDNTDDDDTQKNKSSCCLCSCFANLFSKNNKKKNSKKYALENQPPPEIRVDSVEKVVKSESTVSLKRSSSERIRNINNVFRSKSADFYALLSDVTSDAHTLLLKYFEQVRGLLVLETSYDHDAMRVTSICTTAQQFGEFRQDLSSGKLVGDLEKWLVTEDTLGSLGTKGLKINIECPSDELDQVEQEF